MVEALLTSEVLLIGLLIASLGFNCFMHSRIFRLTERLGALEQENGEAWRLLHRTNERLNNY